MKPLEDQPRCLLDRRTPGVEVLRNSSKPRKTRHLRRVSPIAQLVERVRQRRITRQVFGSAGVPFTIPDSSSSQSPIAQLVERAAVNR